MTPPPSLQDLIASVRRDAGTDDPIGQLVVASATAADLEQTTDALLGHFVDRCRTAGRSWSEISTALGVTKQAVHKRFAGQLAERLTAMTDRPTFERFTQRARNVLVAANAAAQASASWAIGTEHLLLGLYSEPEGLAAKVLLDMQVSRQQVEAALRRAEPLPPAEGSAGAADNDQDEDRRKPGRPGAAPSVPGAPGAPPTDATAEPGAPAAGPTTDTDTDTDTDDPTREPGAPPTGPADPTADRRPMSPTARAVLAHALAVALEFGHNYIGTEHILLGLYREPDSIAARVLAEVGPEPAEAHARVAEVLRGYSRP